MRPTVFLAAACLGMVAACLSLAASSTSNQPVALVVATSGRVEVSRASSKSVERGTIGLALLRGDKVQVGAGGAATLLFSDGNLLELSEKSAITIGAHPRVARSREPNPVMADVFKSVFGGVVGGSRETGLVALAPARRPPGPCRRGSAGARDGTPVDAPRVERQRAARGRGSELPDQADEGSRRRPHPARSDRERGGRRRPVPGRGLPGRTGTAPRRDRSPGVAPPQPSGGAGGSRSAGAALPRRGPDGSGRRRAAVGPDAGPAALRFPV